MKIKIRKIKKERVLRIRIEATDKEKEYLLKELKNSDYDEFFCDLIEEFTPPYGIINSEVIYLSKGYIILENAWLNKDLSYSMLGKAWINYNHSIIEDLINIGYVDFILWKDTESVITFKTTN